MPDKFGLLYDADLLEDQVRKMLKSWMHTGLLELESQRGMAADSLPRPMSYLVAEEVDRELGDNLPSIIVVSPGLAKQPVKEGDGYYRACWTIAVGVVVSAGGDDTRDNTKRLLRRYCAVVRMLMLQRRNFHNVVGEADTIDDDHQIMGVTWIDETYDRLDFEDGQTLAAGEVVFEVEVTNVVNDRLGPVAPTAPDPGEVGKSWGQVADVDVTVNPVATNEEV